MRKLVNLLTVLATLAALSSWAQAGELATLAWDPPTHRIVGTDCALEGTEITPEDVARLEYTVSYRVKDSGQAWTNVDVNVPTVQLDLPYGTTFEAYVGARWPGGTILCASDVLTFVTGAEPPPGACSSFRKLAP